MRPRRSRPTLHHRGRDHRYQRSGPDQLRRSALGDHLPAQDLYFVTFDLLHLNGYDLRDMPLEDRREILHEMIPAGGRIQFSEVLPGTGAAVYHLVDKAGLEGMVSKRKLSRYRSGPTMDWRKIMCFTEKDLEIIGVKRETGKPAMALMADKGRYIGGAFITMNRESASGYGTACRARLVRRPRQGKGRVAEAGAHWPGEVSERRGDAAPCLAPGFSRRELIADRISG
ncbi:hypothetical protein [Mesorhizobium sp. WSM4313]|uniref:ATP-dependent DNA ligase n=1 Tax=Mesorhizobium sp. WSM4313 TaxID=2029412 RepID=UPI001FD87B0F|nr:hypothetical protein [Mesorhizobium sp. WSM4313]